MTAKEMRIRNIVADLRRWGRGATRRVLSGIEKHGVIFEAFVKDGCGCPIAYASGFDPDKVGIYNEEKAEEEAMLSHYRYESVPNRRYYDSAVCPPTTYKKSEFVQACKIVLSSK